MICGSSLIHKLALVIGVPGNGIREAKNHRKHQENYDLKGGCFHEIESCFEKRETQANSEGQMQGKEVLENGRDLSGNREARISKTPYIFSGLNSSFLLDFRGIFITYYFW